mmetsp:Transcript_92660/g.155524  ORF Transcript_92660/g.155524 Transcript_92660/m.155524 type:complete len:140 (+) Transcript_92660:511-930(+)
MSALLREPNAIRCHAHAGLPAALDCVCALASGAEDFSLHLLSPCHSYLVLHALLACFNAGEIGSWWAKILLKSPALFSFVSATPMHQIPQKSVIWLVHGPGKRLHVSASFPPLILNAICSLSPKTLSHCPNANGKNSGS